MSTARPDQIRKAVLEKYRRVAQSATPACDCRSSSCCEPHDASMPEVVSLAIGYSAEQSAAAPAGSDMGLGCGNPLAIASLKKGETVLDLGSGGGFDCFLAARAVGETGHVIGVDMTPEMVNKARRLAADNGFENVEFRLGEIENLPVADGCVDVVISNCVINLSPRKGSVFRETFRVLRPGGRLIVSDVVATSDLPDDIKSDLALHAKCIAGASLVDDLEAMLREAGFVDVGVRPQDESREFIRGWAPGKNVEDLVVSAIIEAAKPI